MKSEFKITSNNTVSLFNGDDELYHIIPSGRHDEYIIVDGGPHFNGETENVNSEHLKNRFGLVIDLRNPNEKSASLKPNKLSDSELLKWIKEKADYLESIRLTKFGEGSLYTFKEVIKQIESSLPTKKLTDSQIEQMAEEHINTPHYDENGHKGSFIAGCKAIIELNKK